MGASVDTPRSICAPQRHKSHRTGMPRRRALAKRGDHYQRVPRQYGPDTQAGGVYAGIHMHIAIIYVHEKTLSSTHILRHEWTYTYLAEESLHGLPVAGKRVRI